jgi:BlaI family transcriptional regulator, penicillinase repressor
VAKRRPSLGLAPVELEIMTVLWRRGPASVHDVQRQLARPLAYTTIQTVLNILVRKEKATRTRKPNDRAYVYRSKLNRAQVAAQVMGDLIDRLFAGSTESFVLSLVETRRLTPALLKKLQRRIDKEGPSR